MSIEDPKEIKKKPEQNDPSGELLKSIKEDLLTALVHKVSDYRPPVVIDCHMHIQSGNCATLPFLWKKTGSLQPVHLGRKAIVILGKTLEFFPDTAHFYVGDGDEGKNATELQKELYRRHKLRDTNEVAKNNTYEIGKYFAKVKMQNVFDFLKEEPLYKGVSQLSFSCVILTMDMECAHLDGYYGIRVCSAIYQKDDPEMKPIDYWYPLHSRLLMKDDRTGEKAYVEREEHLQSLVKRGRDKQRIMEHDSSLPAYVDDVTKDRFDEFEPIMEEIGIPGVYYDNKGNEHRVSVKASVKLLGKEETALYEPWKKQVENTELAVLANPLRLLPLFHYDPRRWQTQRDKGEHNFPFDQVDGSGLFLGFKMYTAQGYRPWDPRLPILGDFYRRCCVGEIPIVNHCTPVGAPTFDLEKYIDFRHPRDTEYDDAQKKACPDPVEYFRRFFVSPEAWRKVLDREVDERPLSDLRLCLAHFGGDDEEGREWGKQILDMMRKYPNVYADLSYSFATLGFRDYFKKTICKSAGFEKKIRHRILFGTDWYLTMLDGVDYEEFCMKAKKFLDSFDTSLWLRFTQANPYAFFRIDRRIRDIAGNIIEKRKDEKIIRQIGELKPGKDEEIRKEAAWIEAANGPYRNYEDTQ